ncbi:amidase family protein [Amphritea sp. HPY]|uniref:amidase family protein n=1 Tax=Amphritea sp. HPY TaxID=3421652 RepID=UPI003D7D6B2E
MSANELINALRNHRISASELLELTISHAERVSTANNPFAVKLYDRARDAAKNADALLLANSLSEQELCGPLCGLPITIKDSQWLSRAPCSYRSETQKNLIPDEACATVKSLEEAGAIIFAKTTHCEFSLTGFMNRQGFIRHLIALT